MALAKTFRFCEKLDSEDCFQLAKDNLYTYSDETGECEITDEELMLLYHENVEIQIVGTGRCYGCKYYILGFTFPSQNNIQFAMRYGNDILRLFKILINSCITV